VIRAGWISLCLLTFATVSFSQPAPSAAPSPTPVQIAYTGRLLGYFRVPDAQSRTVIQPCREFGKDDSEAATKFLTKRRSEDFQDAILVGTGDNFAPRLEARVFKDAEGDFSGKAYRPRNKEFYLSDGNRWYLPEEVGDDDWGRQLRARVDAGEGTIPNDNVACFLAAAGFSAVVPGKHDFYFGPERVRQLARLMAKRSGNYEPVQMLGANLVIKIDRLDNGTAASTAKPNWPATFPVLNLKSVYPWFSYVQVKIDELSDQNLLDYLRNRM